MMSNSESRKRLAEAQRGDEAGALDSLVRLLARHVLSHLTPEHCTADCMARAILTSDYLAARDAEQRRLGAEAVVDAVEDAYLGENRDPSAYACVKAARAAAQQVSEEPRQVPDAHKDGDCNCPSCNRYALVNEAAALGARRGFQEGLAAGKQYGHDLNDSRVKPEAPTNPYAGPSADPCCLRCEAVIYQDDEGVWRRETTGSQVCPRNPAVDGHEPLPTEDRA